jgi:hypothetical protein
MPLAVVRPDTLYAWSGPSLLMVNTRGQKRRTQRLSGSGCRVRFNVTF